MIFSIFKLSNLYEIIANKSNHLIVEYLTSGYYPEKGKRCFKTMI